MKRKPARAVKRHALKKRKCPVRGKRTRKEVGKPTLGENIRSVRTAKGVTQLALAHAIGYQGDDAGAYISRVEANVQAPRIDTLLRIAEALGVTIGSLLSK